ncbi:MAG: leucine-rich repeat protein [Lachnospiraceae bacterium]|nr:leucine-rich repeat protein [Lachnospiraceae bacterium]
MDLKTGDFSTLYTPPASELPEDQPAKIHNIYGLRLDGNILTYYIQTSQDFAGDQSANIHYATLQDGQYVPGKFEDSSSQGGNGTGDSGSDSGQTTPDPNEQGGSDVSGGKTDTSDTDGGKDPADIGVESDASTPAAEGNGRESTVNDVRNGANALKKGTSFTVGGNCYKITKVSADKAEAAFTGNVDKKKKSITIPASVKYQKVTIKVTSVASKALKGRTALTSVTVGKHVTSIGSNAFYGCKKLKTITLKGSGIKTFGKNCIKNIHKKATIKCPKSVRKRYKSKLKAKTGFRKPMQIK